MEDYDGNIAEIPSSPTSVATNAIPPHIARVFEQFNEKERQEIVRYHMKASGDKSTGMLCLFSQHYNITISRNQKLGEVGIGRSGTVAAIGLLIAIQVQILTFKACV